MGKVDPNESEKGSGKKEPDKLESKLKKDSKVTEKNKEEKETKVEPKNDETQKTTEKVEVEVKTSTKEEGVKVETENIVKKVLSEKEKDKVEPKEIIIDPLLNVPKSSTEVKENVKPDVSKLDPQKLDEPKKSQEKIEVFEGDTSSRKKKEVEEMLETPTTSGPKNNPFDNLTMSSVIAPSVTKEKKCLIKFYIHVDEKLQKGASEIFLKFYPKPKKFIKRILLPSESNPRVLYAEYEASVHFFDYSSHKSFRITVIKNNEAYKTKKQAIFPHNVENRTFHLFSYFAREGGGGIFGFGSGGGGQKQLFHMFLDFIYHDISSNGRITDSDKIKLFDAQLKQIRIQNFESGDCDFRSHTIMQDSGIVTNGMKKFLCTTRKLKMNSNVEMTMLLILLSEYNKNRYVSNIDVDSLRYMTQHMNFHWMENMYKILTTQNQIRFNNALNYIVENSKNNFSWGMAIPFMKKYNTYLIKKVENVSMKSQTFVNSLNKWKLKYANFASMSKEALQVIITEFIIIAPSLNCVFDIVNFVTIFPNGDALFRIIFSKDIADLIKLKTATLKKIKDFIEKKPSLLSCDLMCNMLQNAHEYEEMDIDFLRKYYLEYLSKLRKEIMSDKYSDMYFNSIRKFLTSLFIKRRGYVKKSIEYIIDTWIKFIDFVKIEKRPIIYKDFKNIYTLKSMSSFKILQELLNLKEEYFKSKISIILYDIIISRIELANLSTTKEVINFIDLLAKRKKSKGSKKDEIGENVLGKVISSFGEITIENMIKKSKIWYNVFKHDWTNSVVESKISSAKKLFKDLIDKILDKSCSVREIEIITGYHINEKELDEHYLSIEKLANNKKVSKKLLALKRKEVQLFYLVSSLFNTFHQQFLQSKYVDSTEISAFLNLAKEKNSHYEVLVNRQRSFKYITEFLDSFKKLGESNLFLRMWHNEIQMTYEEEEEEEELLTPMEVVRSIYPNVLTKWQGLYKSFKKKNISLSEIEKLFESLNDEAIAKELEVLFVTNKEKEFAKKDLDMILKVMKYSQNKDNIPYLLKSFSQFQRIFNGKVERDPDFINLTNFYENIRYSWQNEKLQNIIVIMFNIQEVLGNYGEDDLALCKILHDSNDLVQWLLDHKNSQSYNELIKVSRGITDDQILIHSFIALSDTRNFLYPLLYPTQKYTNVLQISTRIKEVIQKNKSKISEKLQSVSFVKKNLPKLLTVFQEKTRSIGINACFKFVQLYKEGVYVVSSKKKLVCALKSETFDFHKLEDMQTILYNTKIPDEVKDKNKTIDDDFKVFSKQIDVLMQMQKSVNILFNLGFYPNGYNKTFKVKDGLKDVMAEMDVLKKKVVEWKNFIEFCRNEYYFINNFNMKEISMLIAELNCMFEKKSISEKRVNDFLRIIKRSISTDLKNKILNVWKTKGNLVNKVKPNLMNLCEILDNTFKLMEPDVRSVKLPFEVSDLLSEHDPNICVFSASHEEIPNVILSIFLRKKRLPEVEEVLLCDENTTLEELMLVIYRWKSAKKFLREKRVFVIGYVHLLSYSLQCNVVNFLKKTLPANDASKLVLVSSNVEKQRLINAFSHFFYKGPKMPLPPKELNKSYQIICRNPTNKHDYMICGFFSVVPGSGKTFQIMRSVYMNGFNIGFPLSYIQVPLRERISIERTIDIMNTYSTANPIKAYHFSISPFVDRKINSLLFQLIVLGTIRERQHCKIFHKEDIQYFFVEIPNSPAIEKIPIFNLIPTRNCEVKSEKISFEEYTIVEKGRDFIINSSDNIKIQYVCKYLKGYRDGIFRKGTTFDPLLVKNLPKKECFDLLTRYTRSQNKPSFTIMSNFIKFVYPQFVQITSSNYLSPLVCVEDLAGLKELVIRLLLESSKDFAVRKIDLSFDNDFSKRFKTLEKWEDSNHIILILSENIFNIISLRPEEVDRFMSPELKGALNRNKFDVNFDYNKSKKEEGVMATEKKCLKYLRDAAGIQSWNLDYELESHISKYKDYVLTPDNLLKMIAIVLRFRNNLPVVISGETGCGKSYLIQFLCKLLYFEMRKITCHGGMEEREILGFVNSVMMECKMKTALTFVVFLDEINTANSMGFFKELVCDGKVDGIPIPENMKLIAAINPYRMRDKKSLKEFQSVGLKLKKRKEDPLGNLVYRVYPICDSFIDHVFDFGILPPKVEQEYTFSMIKKKFGIDKELYSTQKALFDLLLQLISESQLFLRKLLNEISVCSLRDIQRTIDIFLFLNNESKDPGVSKGNFKTSTTAIKQILTNYLISIAFVYNSRLSREKRDKYLKFIYGIWKEKRITKKLGSMFSIEEFKIILRSKFDFFTKQMKPPPGIAINEALSENIFMLFLSITNRIPIFIVGPPGSSKSLAVDLISKSLKGQASSNELMKSKANVEVFNYQCSPISTAESISSVFNTARNYAKETSSICCVLLDEISLAELSPHLPLKVLHKELDQSVEEKLVSVIGISNYSLDSAKMNRAIYLLRSTPTTEDLKLTAQGIVNNEQLKNLLNSLAVAYKKVYDSQTLPNYWGLREFYYLVKFINMRHSCGYVKKELLLDSILRNFGGRPENELDKVLKHFQDETGIDILGIKKPSTIDLIKANLVDKNSRHLMLLTINNAALHLLFDFNILQMKKCDIIFASDFPDDKTSQNISLYLKRIKLAMQHGIVVILVHCNDLYESLYDLLNQHYIEVEGRRFANIALGNSTQSCFVDPRFKLITIVEESEAYTKLPAPFLNRLEKRIFFRGSILNDQQKRLYKQLKSFVSNLKSKTNSGDLFKGCHSKSLTSLVMTLMEEEEDEEEEYQANYQLGLKRLIQVMSPESVILTNYSKIFDEYFDRQNHCDFLTYMEEELFTLSKSSTGIMSVVMTYSPLDISTKVMVKKYLFKNETLTKQNRSISLRCIQLHEVTNAGDLSSEIENFFKSKNDESLLLLLCDAISTSIRRIQYLQYECESKKEKFSKSNKKRHIVLVVNLIRKSKIYTFDFDRRWKYIFIDDIRSGAKSLKMMKHSLKEIFTNLNLKELVMNSLHNSLSKLHFFKTNITLYIKQLKEIFANNDLFNTLFFQKILTIITAQPNQKRWYINVAKNERDLLIHGTFKEALNNYITKITSEIIAVILSYVDVDHNITFLTKGSKKEKEIWLSIFKSIKGDIFQPLLTLIQTNNFLEMSENPMNAFPFSNLICEFAHSLKFILLSDDDSVYESLMKQFELLNCKELIEPMQENLIWNYIFDYQVKYNVGETKLKNVYKLLTKVMIQEELKEFQDDKTSLSIPLVQGAYWKIQKKLNVFIPIIANLTIPKEFYKSNFKISKEVQLCQFALDCLNPTNCFFLKSLYKSSNKGINNEKNVEKAVRNWLKLIELTKLSINQLLFTLDLQNRWKKVFFFYYFMRDLALEENLSLKIIEEFWKKMENNDIFINDPKSFYVLIEILSSIVIDSRDNEEYECCVCFEVPEEMRKVVCQNIYCCKKCLGDLIPNGECSMCRNNVNINIHTIEVRANDSEVAQMRLKDMKVKKSSSSLIERFINEFCITKKTKNELVEIIVKYLFENKLKVAMKKILKFQVDETAKISVLRKLFALKLGENFIERELSKILKVQKSLDCDVSFLICEIDKEYLTQNLNSAEKIMNYFNYLQKIGQKETINSLKFLSFSKFVIKRYIERGFEKKLEKLVSTILQIGGEAFVLYFFRVVASRHGMSYLRQNITIKFKLRMLERWKMQNKKEIATFISYGKLRNSNPFICAFGKAYLDAEKAVMDLHIGGKSKLLDKFTKGNAKRGSAIIMCAILENVTLLNTEVEQRPKNLSTWFKSSKRLKDYRRILLMYIENTIPHMKITTRTKLSDIFKLRAMTHSLVFAIMSGGFFNMLYGKISQLSSAFIPTMPDDLVFSIKNAFKKGKFYKCPNGHSYLVTECGRPMQEYNCNVCGARIGGTHHNLLKTNKLLNTAQDSTVKKYNYSPVEDETTFSVRKLTPRMFRMLRFMMHTIMFYSYKDRYFTTFISNVKNVRDPTDFFHKRIDSEWKNLAKILEKNEEETSLSITLCVCKMLTMISRIDTNKCNTKSSRDMFENAFIKSITPVIDSEKIVNEIQMFQRKMKSINKQEGSLNDNLELEILGKNEIPEFDFKMRSKYLPRIMIVTNVFSFKGFLERVKGYGTAMQSSYPYLYKYAEYEEQMGALKYLSNIFQFYKLLDQKFNRKISREEARKKSMKNILATFKTQNEKYIWQKCFNDFKDAWNFIWRFVDRYQCLEIPKIYKNITVNEDTFIAIYLPNEKEESICSLGFLNYIVTLHNDILEEHKELISSNFFSTFHSINYDEEGVTNFIKDHRYDLRTINQFLFDMLFANKPRIDLELQKIDFIYEMRTTSIRENFKKKIKQEDFSVSFEKKFGKIKHDQKKIRKLYKFVEMAINFLQAGKSEFFSGDVSLYVYLKNNLLIDQKLLDDEIFVTEDMRKDIKLKHLDSLWSLLEKCLINDSFYNVDSAYKEKISTEMKKDLMKIIKQINLKEMLNPMKEFILNYLTSKTMAKESSLKATLAFIQVNDNITFGDTQWFKYFPEKHFKMKHALAVFSFLENYLNKQNSL